MGDTRVRKLDADWEVASLKRSKVDLGGLSTCCSNSSCRGTPKRFMFYETGCWHDFPADNSSALCEAFCAGRIYVEVFFKSCIFMVSFVQKLMVNLHTGYQGSIAWVEECGELNLPAHPFEGTMPRSSSFCRQKVAASTPVGCQDGFQGRSEVSTVLKGRISSRVQRLRTGETSYEEVKKLFQDGLGRLSPVAQVTGIYRVRYEGVGPQARLQSFLECKQATEMRRQGDANVQYAWYGCSKSELLTIVQHGFGKPTLDSPGVYLAPKQYSRLSALGAADFDDKTEQYTIFCKVILGRSELVSPGSKQFHPSSEEFDTGVDDLFNPKRFIVWSTHMSTHILPIYVVSFGLPVEWHEIMEMSGAKGKAGLLSACPVKSKLQDLCAQSNTTNPKLFALLKPELPACEMQLLKQYYYEFKCGNLTRQEILRKIRAIAGDAKLKRIQEEVKGSNGLRILGLTNLSQTHSN